MRTLMLLLALFLLPVVHAEPARTLESLERMEATEADAFLAHLRQRAQAGDRTAQYWLGRWLHDLAPLHQRDFTSARDWLERASTAGHVRATAMLARIHEVGFSVPADRDAAARYYQRLLELGVDSAGHDLARIEFNREPRDGARIIAYLEQSARKGHAQSIIDLAFLHAAGTVAEVDGAEAHRWAMRGAELGLPRAMNLLARLYANGLGVEPDAAEALKWAILARDAGDEEARSLAREIADAVPEEVQHEARARALAWRDRS